jgi:ribosome-binding factor A
MASQTRQFKVGDLLQRIVADLLLKDLKDPRVALVSVSSVQVSRDLSFAKIFISILGVGDLPDELGNAVIHKLNDAKGLVRYTIGRKAALRIVPEIAFVWDRTLERGHQLTSLIDKARQEDARE